MKPTYYHLEMVFTSSLNIDTKYKHYNIISSLYLVFVSISIQNMDEIFR